MLSYPTKLWGINNESRGLKKEARDQNGLVQPYGYRHTGITSCHRSHRPCGTLDNSIEDRLHVLGRAANDAEYLGGCRLMFQGFAQFRIALAEFLEQAHVFDGDNGFGGEGFKKLIVCEKA